MLPDRQPLLFSLCRSTMGLDDKTSAAAKAVEGKLQAAAGELTGDEKLKLEGEAKQLQAKVIDAAGDLKDKVQDVAGDLSEKAHDVAGDLKEKAQDVAGDLSEKAHDVAEDLKDKAHDAASAIGNALKGLRGQGS
jgi:uncharacterized protein YjbJ (UPF0337 family)